MKSTRNLRLRLRLIEGALVLGLGALTTGAVATHQLLLDATNLPTGDVSFSGPHWVGTLDAARLPAAINPASIGATTPGAGTFAALSADGLRIFPGSYISTDDYGGCIDASNGGGLISSANNGGNIDTSTSGGSIETNGFGSPIDNGIGAYVGSIYMDQDPSGASGHVLWVMEPSGWVGK